MSFLNKIKQGLGIGTLEAKLNVPGQIDGNAGKFEGDFILTAKSNQLIKEVGVKFEMVRRWEETKHRRDSKGNQHSYSSTQSQTTELGNYIDHTPFEMKANDTKTIHFTIPFQKMNPRSSADAAIEQGGVSAVLGTISKLASTMRNERVEYKVEGKVDLKDAAIDPSDSRKIIVQ
ncbi:MAG: hypothetical protein A3K46_00145 [Chloroflexi bacterium RBG_13_60_9]|nr:MAG: hypothetical protein A3K46_00145 [Chloroflexi bacterium RBG_13_60_9]